MRPVLQVGELSVASLSRLSHLVKRLERRDLVRREPDPDDGRYTNRAAIRRRRARTPQASLAVVVRG